MNLDTLTMPKTEAKQAFIEYRRAVQERHSTEDEQIMRGYKALAQGKQVIELHAAFQRAGQDAQGCPRLAIARADEDAIECRRYNDGRLWFSPRVSRWSSRMKGQRTRELTLPAGTLGVKDPSIGSSRSWDYAAMTPIIPPQFRPLHALSNYHLLWEAEWTRLAPRDPALLKHLGGTLYAVLAMWDLTPVERAVLGVTRN